MNIIVLKFFAIGVALILNGILYFIHSDFLYNNIEFRQVLIALLSILIALMVVNVWANIKTSKGSN
ncbi:MAG TPA: hypothetical protein VMY36_00685 [Patescibacteria group bacterium]|nr:hypothetical protein [Patescibacteria group bacterium]